MDVEIKNNLSIWPKREVKRYEQEHPTLASRKLFPPLARHGQREPGIRNRIKVPAQNSLKHFLDFERHLQNVPIFHRTNECRRLLDSFKIKDIRFLVMDSKKILADEYSESRNRWCDLIGDIFSTKTFSEDKVSKKKKKRPKYMLFIDFINKGFDYIQLSSILHDSAVVETLPDKFQNDEVPSIVYRLNNTIRNKIFNYKQTVNEIDVSDKSTYGTGLTSCQCHNSSFVDDNYGHIATGDLRFIENSVLRKLLCKGPNYREPQTINWKKCREKISIGLEVCAKEMGDGENGLDLSRWQNIIMEKVGSKIEHLKKKITPRQTNPVLKREDVQTYLKNLQKHFVLVPIDKASNNIAIICKRFYVEVILKEVGVLGDLGNPTYTHADRESIDIISENCEYTSRLGYDVSENDKILPIMYWIPKMHKSPMGHRFIIASKVCCTKKVSKSVSSAFKLIFGQVECFHRKAKFNSHYAKFWVLQNVDPVIDILKKINKRNNAKSISTYDFSTLYTKIPHSDLINRLSKIISFVFEGGDAKYVNISETGYASWGRSRSKTYFSQSSLKIAVKHLIQNCYFTVGNITMRQAIGIPMGIDPAPFWENLYLYSYEEEFVSNLVLNGVPEGKVRARHFHASRRFIDDLCAINDGGEFGRSHPEIYPPELELKEEHAGHHATFLCLEIKIEGKKFIYKLYDKRDNFPFDIVRMPHMSSNIPKAIFYSALVGEFLRIGRSTLKFEHFETKAKELLKRMLSQGANPSVSHKMILKIMSKHPEDFIQFKMDHNDILESISR